MSVGDKIDFESLAENSADILCSAGMDRVLRYVSSSSVDILGWKPEEMVGKLFDDFIVAGDLPIFAEASAAACENATIRMRKKDGSAVWMENHSRIVHDSATGEPKEYVVVMRDISDRKKHEDQLAALALTDGPTGLANRRAFDGALDLEWKRTLRRGTHISLLMLDIVPRKGPNGESKPQDGDDCVRTAAAAMNGVLRATDFVARYDGSEIAVILPTADIANAALVAQRVRSAVEALESPDGEKREGGWLIANIGVATGLARHGGTMKMPETLLLAADHAVQESMREGQTFCAWQVDMINFGGLVWPTAAR